MYYTPRGSNMKALQLIHPKNSGKFGILNHVLHIPGIKKDIIVRPAKPWDYEGVMAIPTNLFGGADYLPSTFHSYFSDPCAYPYVADDNGTVVSFGNCYIVDDGCTVVVSGARTVSHYQSMGIFAQVKIAALHAASQRYPQPKKEARVVSDKLYDKYRTNTDPQAFKIVVEQNNLLYQSTKSSILDLLNYLESSSFPNRAHLGTSYMNKPTSTLTEAILNSPHLLPSTIISPIHFLPMSVYRENLDKICSTTDVVTSMDEHEGECFGISFSVLLNLEIGPCLTMRYYVKSMEDMFHHLKVQLQQKHDEFEGEGQAILDLAFPMDISLRDAHNALFPYLGSNQLSDKTLMVLERPFKVS